MSAQSPPSPGRDDVLDLTRELLRIDTINPPGNEREAAEVALAYARSHGLDGDLQPLGDSRANLRLVLRGEGEQAPIMYCGHLDTVPLGTAPWTRPPHAAEVEEDGVLWGRGAVDMKGGLAAMLVGLTTLARTGTRPPGDVHLLATAGEEVDCAGARAARDAGLLEGVGGLVIAEPTDLDLVVAHKGALFLEFVTRGRAAHGSMPDQGVNAITHMTTLLDRLSALDLGSATDPLLGGPTASVGTVQGGSVVNIVPDRCTAQVDLRSVPGVDHAVLLQRIERMLSELALTVPDFDARMTVTGDYAAVGTDPGEPLVRTAREVLAGVLGRPPGTSGVSYFSDASILQPGTGLPTVLCGPGDPNLAHQTDERVHVDDLRRAAEFFTLLPLAPRS
ncbi:M20 family metallopeptidase [Lentzea cavernae]|uniref:Peptidase M20 n=1 Tax=Lentzea cavernae TaxID=2020703 RepID=A0ABQ3LXP0_9PSEU|nr:M20 family metallopeptidase [Lentzea cavernae]GHH27970.1 peptidase M20 [Lentzea cavernae]